MKTTRTACWISFVVIGLLATGCAIEEPPGVAGPPTHAATTCVDGDGDGAGEGCAMLDCDDGDPAVAATCDATPAEEMCTEGQTRECTVDLGENNGVKSCFVGAQTCSANQWGACGGAA